ncbi:unnamed protein product, partial [Prorocentrum cordatum]
AGQTGLLRRVQGPPRPRPLRPQARRAVQGLGAGPRGVEADAGGVRGGPWEGADGRSPFRHEGGADIRAGDELRADAVARGQGAAAGGDAAHPLRARARPDRRAEGPQLRARG